MNLWLLRPVSSGGAWDPWYDKAFGFVVRAETEQAARELAQEDGGDETRAGQTPWLDPAQSTCIPLTDDGETGIVIQDFHSA